MNNKEKKQKKQMDPEELLVIEPIIGYRSFIIGYDFPTQVESPYDMFPHINFYLRGNGIGKDYIWKKGKNIASCIKAQHDSTERVPVFNCECGFYAYKGKFSIIAEAESTKFVIQLMERESAYRRFCSGYYIVLGKVNLSGKVIEHEYGYRAEFAEIKEIIWILDIEVLRLDFLYNKYNYKENFYRNAYVSMPAPSKGDADIFNYSRERIGRIQPAYVKNSLSRFYQLPIIDYQQFLNEVDK